MLFALEGNIFHAGTDGGCVIDSFDAQRSVWRGCHLLLLHIIADRSRPEQSLEDAAIVPVCLFCLL